MLGEDVKKFTFKNCGSIFGTYFYDVRNIRYSYVSIQKEKEVRSLDQYSQNTMDLVTEQLTTFVQRTDEDMGYYANSEMIRNMLQDGVTQKRKHF